MEFSFFPPFLVWCGWQVNKKTKQDYVNERNLIFPPDEFWMETPGTYKKFNSRQFQGQFGTSSQTRSIIQVIHTHRGFQGSPLKINIPREKFIQNYSNVKKLNFSLDNSSKIFLISLNCTNDRIFLFPLDIFPLYCNIY